MYSHYLGHTLAFAFIDHSQVLVSAVADIAKATIGWLQCAAALTSASGDGFCGRGGIDTVGDISVASTIFTEKLLARTTHNSTTCTSVYY